MTDDYQIRLAEIRTRTQAAQHCRLCDPMGYLPDGQLCHHNPDQTPSANRVAAKARARAAAEAARQKSKWKPAPPPSERRSQEPEQEQPANASSNQPTP